MRSACISLLAILCVVSPGLSGPTDYNVNAQLSWHKAVLDSRGKLLAWYQPEKNRGYDKVLRLGWGFMEHKVPKDTRRNTGLKVYLVNSVFDDETLQGSNWQHNPAMVYATMVESLVAWYPYSGDAEAAGVVREMLDYELEHGTTPSDWDWASVPFATSCDSERDYGRCLQDMPREFYGGIETDKVGALGYGYALFYEMTGERKYLDAAIRAGDALAKHVRAGDAEHTPWPFRVYAKTGETLASEEYGGEIVDPVRLFDELIRLQAGNTESFRKARDVAWKWLIDHPLNRYDDAWDKWSGYFEDVPRSTQNVNQALPTVTAYYILNRENPADVDKKWSSDAGHLIDWVRQRLGRGPFLGAWAIDEQTPPGGPGCCDRVGEGSDTSRWAAINALYYEKTLDGQAREDAFRSLNYATYFAADDGKISCCGQGFEGQYWFSDGYSDYLRHFNWVMGAIPDLAPIGEDHLLRSSSVVRMVKYAKQALDYSTFDSAATEVLRLTYNPRHVTSGGFALSRQQDRSLPGYTVQPVDGGDYVVRIRHAHSEVSISGK
jgi:hypothetical protein